AWAMERDRAVLFPVLNGALPHVDVLLSAASDTVLGWQLHRCDGRGHYIPSRTLAEGTLR
ncbi:MAG: hypothetical protein KIS92_11480, partial [Planctomycetota bacterium]|nr:hypothetical protein [Planctomycetota bacterium]